MDCRHPPNGLTNKPSQKKLFTDRNPKQNTHKSALTFGARVRQESWLPPLVKKAKPAPDPGKSPKRCQTSGQQGKFGEALVIIGRWPQPIKQKQNKKETRLKEGRWDLFKRRAGRQKKEFGAKKKTKKLVRDDVGEKKSKQRWEGS